MKYLILILVVLSAGDVIARQYVLNIYASYKSKSQDLETESACYANENDLTYFLETHLNHSQFASITDLKNMKVHNFKMIEEEIDGRLNVSFKYLYSVDREGGSERKSYSVSFTTLNEDNLGKKILMRCDWNTRKNVVQETTLNIHNYNKNLFKLFHFMTMKMTMREDVNPQVNGFVESSITTGKYPKSCKMTAFKKVEFTIYVGKLEPWSLSKLH